MRFFFKSWLLVALVYIGLSHEAEGSRRITKEFEISSFEDLANAAMEVLQTCQSAPSSEELTSTPMSTSSSNDLTTASTSEQITVEPTPAGAEESTSSETLTTEDHSTEAPSSDSNDQTSEPILATDGTTNTPDVDMSTAAGIPLGSLHDSCGVLCDASSVLRYERKADHWVGQKIAVTNAGNFFCGCTCEDQHCFLKKLVEDCQYIVVQRRVYGNVTFGRELSDYKQGFGDMTGDYWIGLEKLSELTKTFTGARLAIYFVKSGNGQDELESANKISIDAADGYRLRYESDTSDSYWNDARERTFLVSSSTSIACSNKPSGWWGDAASDWCNPNSEYKDRGVRMNHPSISGGLSADFIEIRLYLAGQSEASCPKKR